MLFFHAPIYLQSDAHFLASRNPSPIFYYWPLFYLRMKMGGGDLLLGLDVVQFINFAFPFMITFDREG